MPKKYEDEKLREQALALRKEGLSYREIASKLGCSTYKVSQLLGAYERDRKKKIGEMTAKVKELEEKIAELEDRMNERIKSFNEKIDNMESKLYKVEHHIFEIENKDIVRKAIDLSRKVNSLEADMELVKGYLDILDIIAEQKMVSCIYYSEVLGGCSKWKWNVTPKNPFLREATKEMGSSFIYVPERFPALCAVCPFYARKTHL